MQGARCLTMQRTDISTVVEVEAINLKINGIECTGTFFYNLNRDIRFSPPIHLCRRSYLEFIVPSDTSKKQVDSIMEWFTHQNEVEIMEDGKTYKGFVSSWDWPIKGSIGGRVEMLDKWYE